jgi:uncharacterized membrane protein YkvA (DUF1232 family)
VSAWAQVRRLLALLGDSRVPKLPRLAVMFALAYLVWPVDLVPDFVVPVAGYLDDAVVLWMTVRWLLGQKSPDLPQLPPPIPAPPPPRPPSDRGRS